MDSSILFSSNCDEFWAIDLNLKQTQHRMKNGIQHERIYPVPAIYPLSLHERTPENARWYRNKLLIDIVRNLIKKLFD